MSAASEIIRQHLEALHEDLRWPWAVGGDGHLYAQEPGVDGDFWVAEADTHETAKHIALLASPHVAEALAELLDALDRWEWVGSDTAMDEHVAATRGLRDARRALAAAISREGRSDG